MENKDTDALKQVIDERVAEQLKSGLFTARKLTDNPTDDLQVVNRRYTNLNGTSAQRPNSSVATLGQQYFDTTAGYPIFRSATNWVSATGSVVGV